MLLTASVSAQTKISEHALGIRAGGAFFLGNEITYQYGLSEANRLQFDFGAHDKNGVNALSLAGTYQWVLDLPELNENVRWFYGAGAGFSFLDRNSLLITDGNFNLINVLGIVGIEYDFKTTADLPLLLAADVNPAFNLFNNNIDNLDLNISISLRWQF